MAYYDDEMSDNDYSDWGNRTEYLKALADDYGMDVSIVFSLADMLGPSEDFDGLICELEDAQYFDQF